MTLAARGGARGRAEREERALQVAPRRLRALAGAEVPADGPLRADLEIGDVARARPERRGAIPASSCTGVVAPIVTRDPSFA